MWPKLCWIEKITFFDIVKRQSNYPLAHIIVPNGSNDMKITTLSFVLLTPENFKAIAANNLIKLMQWQLAWPAVCANPD